MKIKIPKYEIATHTAFKEIYLAYYDSSLEGHSYEESYKVRNLDFRSSEAVHPSIAKKIMDVACPGYNNFESSLIELLPDDCLVTIAREGSVCLYVTPGKKKIPSAKLLLADEFDVQENGDIRIWWD